MPPAYRIQSIDFLRGVIMVIMAIDHSRTFLHSSFNEFNPEDLTKTTPVLFFTRWITHYCAPNFIFLTGVAGYLMLQKIQSKKQMSGYLVSRALILVLLELTLFRFCWAQGHDFFQPFFLLVVIWAIAISMLFLALVIWLPYRVILAVGVLILLLHNTLTSVHFPENTWMFRFWAFFYSGGYVTFPGNVSAIFLYPVLPYFGLISLGYCLGKLFGPSFTPQRRKTILIGLGTGAIILFIVLRYFNIYGDPRPWVPQNNVIFSLMAFLRATKYPVSLLFALMTIGPALLVLAFIEPVRNKVTSFFVTIGSVPMFYYILHLILFVSIGFIGGFNKYNLAIVYVWFAIVVAILFLLCRWYSKYKFSHPEKKWLRYL
jgi:uncharacterized membrane protein